MPQDTSQKERTEQDRNIGQAHANRMFDGQSLSAREQNAWEGMTGDNFDNTTAKDPQENEGPQKIARSQEERGDGRWVNKVSADQGQTNNQPNSRGGRAFSAAMKFAKKRKGIIGIISTFAVGGGILAGFFGPASMLVSLSQNLTDHNDTSSPAMERRFMKTFSFMNSGDVELSKNPRLSDRMGRITNGGLRRLNNKGITAVFSDGSTYKNKRIGYPKKGNPTRYTIDMGDGKKPITVNTKDLPGFLTKKENAGFVSKFLGRSGAFNFKVRAWAGGHISRSVYAKFLLDKSGGTAGPKYRKDGSKTRMTRLRESVKIRQDKLNNFKDKIKGKVGKTLGPMKKGGPAYMVAAGSCVAVKAPAFVAAGIAGVQLAQAVPFAMDMVLSSGSRVQAGGIDPGNTLTGEDVAAASDPLTERVARESDGKLTSALDSAYLLAALGANTGRVPISKTLTPGYAALTSGTVTKSRYVDKKLEPACNGILSPAGMYTAMAVDSASTVLLSATVIGGVIKIGASWAISYLASQIVQEVVAAGATAFIKDLVKNDAIATAQGEALGDVIGIGAMAFFSSGGMARHLPVLSKSQLVSAAELRKENEAFNRDMEVASLSPFDTSSKHTFLGSIVNNMRLAMISQGNYNASPQALVSNIIKMPSLALATNVNAATDFTANYCDYASDFNVEGESADTTPAVNVAGLPCTGLTQEQNAITTEEALALLKNEGWIKDDDDHQMPLDETFSIPQLLEKGIIVKDTPLADFIESCSDASSGDYLFNAAGCTVGTGGKSSENKKMDLECSARYEDDEGNATTACATASDTEFNESDLEGVKDPRSLSAMAVFLVDYQVMLSINEEDPEERYTVDDGETTPDSGSDSVDGLPPATGKLVSPIPDSANDVRITAKYGYNGYGPGKAHWGLDMSSGRGDGAYEFVSACDGVVDRVAITSDANKNRNTGVSGTTNYAWIKCDNGVYMGYAHFYADTLKSYIKPGYRISAGTPIAPQGCQGNSRGRTVGREGKACGSHLHFQINPTSSSGYNAAKTRDPQAYLQQAGVSLP